jgi:hypothetical protein
VASKDERIIVSGRFPDARYASLAVYAPDGSTFTSHGVGSSLADYQIAARSGSRNPWQHRAGPGGRYTVTIRSDVSPGQVNTLPLPSGTTSRHPGYFVYRVYLPAGGGFSGVDPPVLAVEQGGVTRTLAACQQHSSAVPAPERSPGGAAARTQRPASVPSALTFYKPGSARYSGLLGNAGTDYVAAWLARPPASEVVVVTGKAPTFPAGSHPSPWPGRGEDVRYWSMCIGAGTRDVPTVANTLPGGAVDYGCRADDATRLNSAGDYAYVIGGESQRAAINRIPGVTFLPFSTSRSASVYVLLLRYMLVSGSFTHSVTNTTPSGDPAAAAAAMGPYYPHAAVCPLATLAAKGVQACVHGS